MYDLVIRSLAALELIIMINADQVTTSTVAASLCVLSLLEASALADARNEERSQILAWILFASSYIGVAGYLLLTNGDRSPYFPLLLTVLSFISSLLLLHLNHANEKMRQELHRTRDDSEELTEVLREQNRRLLNEQDQCILRLWRNAIVLQERFMIMWVIFCRGEFCFWGQSER